MGGGRSSVCICVSGMDIAGGTVGSLKNWEGGVLMLEAFMRVGEVDGRQV